jgi:hypothetical protein
MMSTSDGLIGLWGHQFNELNHIALQFQIIRKSGNSYVVQVYSFENGKAAHCKVISRADILKCKLFPDVEAMNADFDKKEAILERYRRNPPAFLRPETARAGLH